MENADVQRRLVRDPPQLSDHVLLHVPVADVHRLDHETRRLDLGAGLVELHVQRERVGFEQPQLEDSNRRNENQSKSKTLKS